MPWYQEFFNEDYMRFHLHGGEGALERAPAECDFVVSALELHPGARILDLCCGQGRHSIELARRGYIVTGLDLSDYLLRLARERAERENAGADFVHGDMRDLSWKDEFDAVVNLWTAFGYLETEAEDERVLRAIHGTLRPGGRLLMDLMNRERMGGEHSTDWQKWDEYDGCLILENHHWNVLSARETTVRTIIEPDGRRRETGYVLRMYAHPEIAAMLSRAGLEWRHTYGDYDGSDYAVNSRRMLVVARKPLTTLVA